MVTFAQAQERAEEWVNGDVPPYQHREVRVREFELGFVVWAEDRPGGVRSEGGRQRLVIARDSGEATLWPGLPVGEVIRRYEEEYGPRIAAPAPAAPAAPPRIDHNQTSFLLTPPEWAQDGAGAAPGPGSAAASAPAGPAAGAGSVSEGSLPGAAAASGGPSVTGAGAGVSASGASGASLPGRPAEGGPDFGASNASNASNASQSGGGSRGGDGAWSESSGLATPPPAPGGPPVGADPSTAGVSSAPAGADASGVPGQGSPSSGGNVQPPAPGASDGPAASGRPGPPVGADASAASGSSSAPGVEGPKLPVPGTSGGSHAPGSPAASDTPASPRPGWTDTAGAGDEDASVPLPDTVYASVRSRVSDDETPEPLVDADMSTALMEGGSRLPPTAVRPTMKAPIPHAAAPGSGSAPAGAPAPGSASGSGSGPGPDAPRPAGRSPRGGGPTTPPPPGPPGIPGAPAGGYVPTRLSPQLPSEQAPPPAPPGPPSLGGGATPPAGGVHQAATVLSEPSRLGRSGAGAPPPPGPPGPLGATPPPYGHPQQPAGLPTVGPGYQVVLRYRAPDGSEARLIRRSAPGTPHPEWQLLHELRALNVPPQQVLELHTELESCRLPGGYCARMIGETWPQARITSIAPYGTDHASRRQGMNQLITHQGELHQVADGPARPAPVRAPLPQVQQAPPIPPQGVAHELVSAFGPQGICRFDQRAVSRQGVPEIVAATLMWAGLPADFNPFFWAQPAHPVVPTLAELAAQRQVQAAIDAGSYLVVGNDFGRAICVQYGTAHIVAVPVEAGPGGQATQPQFVNSGLPEFVRCMALLGRMWRFRYGLNPEQAGRWTVDFQAQLAALDPAALSSPENWWSVLLEQMWDGLL